MLQIFGKKLFIPTILMRWSQYGAVTFVIRCTGTTYGSYLSLRMVLKCKLQLKLDLMYSTYGNVKTNISSTL
jgi:hypothetical protein